MARIKNLSDAIVKEPETAGAEIERKNLSGKDANPADLARQSYARPLAGKTPRPTDKLGA